MTAAGSPPPPSAAVPPGWYPSANGPVRWWDGAAWGPALPEKPVDPSLAVLPHLGFFVMPVVAALVVRVTLGAEDPFIKHHATEALNLQIWFVALWNLVGLPFYVYLMVSWEPDVMTFVAVWLTMFGLFALTAVLSAVAAWKAYRRVWWRYPVTPYRFVRGARPPIVLQGSGDA
jgi:uncharacterized Tic20 family protein